MKADRLRRFIDLHAWVGMVSGLILFVAFFAGAINVFHHELHHWQAAPHGDASAGPADPDDFIDTLIQRFPQAADRFYFLPDDNPAAMWQQDGEWRTASAADFSGKGEYVASDASELADFINELHYELAIPSGSGLLNIGMTFMGLIAVLYGFGGLVHVGNIVGFGELKWSEAPLAWKLGDVVWGLLDIVAVVGIVMKAPLGILAVVVAALSQIVVYGFFPDVFALSDGHRSTLRGMVYFNAVVLVALGVLVYFAGFRSGA